MARDLSREQDDFLGEAVSLLRIAGAQVRGVQGGAPGVWKLKMGLIGSFGKCFLSYGIYGGIQLFFQGRVLRVHLLHFFNRKDWESSGAFG